jgi:hypothetical protein
MEDGSKYEGVCIWYVSVLFYFVTNYSDLVQFWVQLLPLKVRQWVHFPHPFLEYVFYYCALTVY